jgi:hypothetical protein
MNRQVSRIALAFVLIFGVTMFALAQQSKQGRISGRVTDPQDYVVYQADVQVINLDTHAATPQKTDTKSAAITLAAGQELVQNVQLRKSGKKD